MRMFFYLAYLISFAFGDENYGRSGTRPSVPVFTDPKLSRTCRWGSVGPCGRFGCPAGSTCQRNWSHGTWGTCCRNGPEQCYGFCGGIGGIPCPTGKTCVLDSPFPDAGGKCCRFACYGFCGGIGGIPCPAGKTCVLDGPFPDAGGKCCTDSSRVQH